MLYTSYMYFGSAKICLGERFSTENFSPGDQDQNFGASYIIDFEHQ